MHQKGALGRLLHTMEYWQLMTAEVVSRFVVN